MLKSILKKRLAFILAVIMIFGLLPAMPAFAADVNTGVTGLSAASSGAATWSSSNGTINGSVAAKATTSCGSTSYSSQNGTLTFTNSSGGLRMFSFDYTVGVNGGSITVDGTAVTAGGSFSKKLDPYGTVAVVLTSNESNNTATTISISNMKLIEEKEITLTLKAPTNGSYTCDGAAITTETTKTVKTTDIVALAATPASGYKFRDWYNETDSTTIGTDASISTSFAKNATIFPRFVSSSTPVFLNAGKTFTDLNAAVANANNNTDKKIVLISNGTLPAGDYLIPSGVTLLMPMDAGYTVVKEEPTVIYGSHTTPSAYSLLTMASGANITVQEGGAICCAGNLCATGQFGGWNGCPTGPDGRIKMNSESTITLNSGAKLYCWGYIYGSGSVVAKSGSTVYEAFQIKDWRGGTATSNCYSYTFIFNQYYVQNIEVPLTVHAGAIEKLWSSANASSSAYPMGATLIGSGGLFNLSSGYLVKDYIESTDRLQIDIYGNASITTMTITGLPAIGSISTTDYAMPVTSNMTLNIHSGTTTVQQDIKLLPSVEITIDDGAVLNIGNTKKVYVYDNDNWGNFTGSARLYVIGYSVANGTTAKRNAAGLVDAKIDVNGTVTVAGKLYTSAGGANITSSGTTGTISFTTAPDTSNSTIYEMDGNKTKTGVTFNPARLKNGINDPQYTETAGAAANTTFFYCPSCNKWETEHTGVTTYTITWVVEGQPNVTTTVNAGETPTYPNGTPTKAATAEYTYTFAGWSDGTTTYEQGTSLPAATADATYTATFTATKRSYAITWKNDDGSVIDTTTVEYGTVPTHADPTKAADAQYTYTFAGWTPTPVAVTGEATYTATFTQTVNKYTVTWIINGESETQEYEYGATPTHDVPTKPSTAQWTYSFEGWSPAVAMVIQNVTYTAVFSEHLRTYTVTWYDEDGSILETDLDVSYGSMPSYDGTDPVKEKDDQYEYYFTGWEPDFTEVTGDATYTAVFTPVLREYTITWQDDTGNVIGTTTVAYGTVPTHDGPTKEASEHYTYNFTGWDPEPVAVTGDATYKAKFEAVPNQYTITFDPGYEDHPYEQLYTETYPYGTVTINYSGYEREGYDFVCWNSSDGDVIYNGDQLDLAGDITLTAQWNKLYTITWVDGDGNTLKTDQYVDGVLPVYDGPVPTKTADAQYTYTFNNTWSPAIVPVTEAATYTAQFDSTVNKYTITWMNDDDTVIDTTTVAYGETPQHEAPTKPATAQFTFSFAGWSPTVTPVTGPATYKAVFSNTINKYTITWKNDDGSVIDTTTVEYGVVPTHADPTKAATAEYTYTFAGWTPTPVAVTGEATYTATFTQTVNKYTITWKDGDGNTLNTEQVEYGETPSYEGKTPTKTGDAQYTYTFNNTWSPAIEAVTGDATYTAQFDSTVNKYTITWQMDDGALIDTTTVAYGETPQHAVPTKPATAQFTFSFAGWSPAVTPVTGPATYKAVFSNTINKYTVTFFDEDGTTVLKEATEYAYGTPAASIVKPADPTKLATAQYTYTFAGWTPEIAEVTANATYTATYTSTVNKYTITWKDGDGNTLNTEQVEYGETPSYEGKTPTKTGDAQYTYTFNNTWSPAIEAVTGDATYTAQFSATVNKYTVTFVDEDGTTVLKEATEYEYGTPVKDIVKPADPTKPATAQYTYVFAGWNPALAEVTEDVTYKATYTTATNTYTVTWNNYDGSKLAEKTYEYGETPVYPGESDPARPADAQYTYTFAGWTPDIATVTGPQTYTATFESHLRSYTITFVNYDGTVLQSGSVAYGEIPVYTGETPTKEATTQYSFTFSGWDPEIKAVDGEATYTAKYTENLRTYTIKFVNENGDVLQSSEVEYGKTPVYTGDTPTKEGNAQYSYTFSGWTPDIGPVYGEKTYTAKYTQSTNRYEVKWIIGNVEERQYYDYGDTPSHADPIKAATAEFTYTFAGWTLNGGEDLYGDGEGLKPFQPVTGNQTYTATFTATKRSYTITWNDDEGNLIDTTTVEYGTVPTHADPTKAASAEYTYTFAGWDPEVVAVTGEATYTATFTATRRSYTITWNDDEGNLIDTTTVEYGVVPTHADPTKAATAEYTYTFAGWDPEVVAVTGNQTYTATFTATKRSYTITWNDDEGNLIDTTTVEYGVVPTHADPTKAATAEYTYTFAGWDPEVVAVTGEATYTATFTASKNSYTITWNDDEGNLIDTTTVEYGVVPTHADPTKAATAEYTYTFAGWDPEVVAVTGDATYTATFTSAKNSYTITWNDDEGNLIDTTTVEYGTVPTHADPTKAATGEYTYTFKGWDPEISEVHGDITYTATFDTWRYPAYEWTQTETGWTCTATLECVTDQNLTVTETVTAVRTEENNVATYTATFANSAFETQKKTVDIFYYLIGSMTNWVVDENYAFTVNPAVEGEYMLNVNDLPERAELKVVRAEGSTKLAWYPDNAGNYVVDYAHSGNVNVYFRPAGNYWNDFHEGGFFYISKLHTVTIIDDGHGTATIDPAAPDYTANVTVTITPNEGYSFDKIEFYKKTGAGENEIEQVTLDWNAEAHTFTMPDHDLVIKVYFKINTYTVTWKNYDGTTLETDENVPYGTMPTYDGATPTKPATAEHSYAFAGWDPAVSEVHGDITYTATFTETVNTYTVIWKNYDGTELEKDENVPYGTVPTFDGATPTKPATSEHSYAFAGWDPAVSEVHGDITYTATFTEATNTYTVTWNNSDGTPLETDENVPYGTTPEYNGATPTKPADAQYTYTFDKWSPDIAPVTGNVTYTATFTAARRSYTITWNDDEGNLIDTTTVEYGTVPTHADPVKAATAQYTYSFTGWTPEVVAVAGEATYTATFEATVNKYTVTFVNDDGTAISEETYDYGTPASDIVVPDDPAKEADAQYTYAFAGWDPEIADVTADATYTATYTKTVNQYKVTFVDDDNTVISENMYDYGTPVEDIVKPADPTKPGDAQYSYEFSGWSPELAEVTADATYTATYTSTVNKYTIKFVNEDGTVLQSNEVEYGSLSAYTGETPIKPSDGIYDFEFIGWTDGENMYTEDLPAVTGEATYTAVFERVLNTNDLTIRVTLTAEEEMDRMFIFNVVRNNAVVVKVPVVVKKGEKSAEAVVKGLARDAYTVEEVTGWSWAHTVTDGSITVDLTEESKTVNFDNAKKSGIHWLNAEAYLMYDPKRGH